MKNWRQQSIGIVWLTAVLTAQTLAAGQWLHVRVEEPGQGETVKVNVPLALAESVLPLLDSHDLQRQLRHHGLKIGRHHWSVEELRQVWEKAKAEQDFEFLSIEKDQDKIRVAMEGDSLVVRGREDSHTEFDVRIPTQVVDALLSGSGDELNFRAALEALTSLGSQQYVLVKERDSTVRVWIDQQPGQ
ncbi:MAG: hypothetical protein V3T83_07180 [Acidobacteriota bacterium]